MAACSVSVSSCTGERESEPEREGKGEGGLHGVQGRLQEVASVAWAQAGGGVGGGQEQATQLLPVLNEEDNRHFCKKPPGHWRFLWKV
jgi:hypothetical protein